jgi:hypothetical protein
LLKSNQDVDGAIELQRDRIAVVSVAPSTALIALGVRVITIAEVRNGELIGGAVLQALDTREAEVDMVSRSRSNTRIYAPNPFGDRRVPKNTVSKSFTRESQEYRT